MDSRSRFCLRWASILILSCLSGCTIVTLDKPLTDEATSVIDKRLIGYWQDADTKKNYDGPPPPFVIGRVKDKKNMLELVGAGLDEHKNVSIQRVLLYATSINDEHYLTAAFTDNGKQFYTLVRYKFVDDDTVRTFLLNTEVLATAIEKHQLAGVVVRDEKSADKRLREVRITAEPAELTKYLKEHGAACFVTEGGVARRVK